MQVHVLTLALMLAAALSTAASGQGAPRIVVGDNPSLSGAPLYVALEKGYYREAGLDVQMEMSGTSSDTLRSRRPLRSPAPASHHARAWNVGPWLLSKTLRFKQWVVAHGTPTWTTPFLV